MNIEVKWLKIVSVIVWTNIFFAIASFLSHSEVLMFNTIYHECSEWLR